MDIMKNIESLRREKGVNQSILASSLGMTQGAYSQRVNNGNSNGFECIKTAGNARSSVSLKRRYFGSDGFFSKSGIIGHLKIYTLTAKNTGL